MRLFVAIPVPLGVRQKAAELGKELTQDGIVPVRPENMHVTLKFLDEVDEKKLGDVEAKLREVEFEAFDCETKGVGVFPDETYIRVVWAGIESGGRLKALANKVIGALSDYGGDTRFSAHLTIARVKRKVDLGGFLGKHREDAFGTFSVSGFELIQSELGPGGPKYTTIASFEAKK